MGAKVTTALFIARAIKLHGHKYDYHSLGFTIMKSPVSIYCRTCEVYFTQRGDAHLAGSGCKTCGTKKAVITRKKTMIWKYPDRKYKLN